MTERTPMQLLEAILDEVEGLRQTNKRSFLPPMMLLELRAAVGDSLAPASTGMRQFRDIDSLEGETITHVFDSNLLRGDLLIMCESGSFVVLEAEGDSDDGAYITTMGYGGNGKISDYLRPAQLHEIGAMTKEQKLAAEEAERKAAAEQQIERAKRQLAQAQAALDKINGVPAPLQPLPKRQHLSNPLIDDALSLQLEAFDEYNVARAFADPRSQFCEYAASRQVRAAMLSRRARELLGIEPIGGV